MNTPTITNRRTKRTNKTPYVRPKKLSKAGEFMKNHPGGIVTIVDYRAVCK